MDLETIVGDYVDPDQESIRTQHRTKEQDDEAAERTARLEHLDKMQRWGNSRLPVTERMTFWSFALKYFPEVFFGTRAIFSKPGLPKLLRQAPTVNSLVAAADLFPSPKTRKLLKKMLADQAEHIQSLSAKGRNWSAWWIWTTSWIMLIWYAAHGLLTSVMKAIKGRAA